MRRSMQNHVRKSNRQSHIKLWAFRFAAIIVSLLIIVAVEIVLRMCSVGHDTTFVITSPNHDGLHQFNPNADRSYYGSHDIAGPEPRPFELPNPEGTFRIVVVGGSTVVGFPYPFELAIPKHLEVILNQQQLPNLQFEVLNAGITSINSFAEVDIVKQIINQCKPDLVVVHSGHNEFYGPGGSASNASGFSPNCYKLLQSLRRTRMFQVATSLRPQASGKHLIEKLPANINIRLNDTTFQETLNRYQRNLESIISIAAQANVPLVISTVPSNLRDLAPLNPPTEKARVPLKAIANHMSYREYEQALDVVREAQAMSVVDPLIIYRSAQCLEALNRDAEAAAAYIRAADLDGCRFRAPSQLLEIVRSTAQAHSEVILSDVALELTERSSFPVPGNDFFLEHVHYSYDGTWQAAAILSQSIIEEVLNESWYLDRVPTAQQRDELLGATPLDLLAADSLTLIIFEAWPLNLSPARIEETRGLRARIAQSFQALDQREKTIFSAISMTAMEQSLWLAMGQAWLNANLPEDALVAFERQIHRRPWGTDAYDGAAIALDLLGESEQAQQMRQNAMKYAPTGTIANSSMGK